MNKMKESFIRLAIENQVLKFGQFTLKSGRQSPYFFNAGMFQHGEAIRQLGCFYADILVKNKIEFNHLFGPAYKGIPLATATAIALSEQGIDVTLTFNRKEAKTHGEGGQLIGSALPGKTVVIDDVITAGTAFREAQQLILDNGGQIEAVVIALDRCERGQKELSTLEEIKAQGIKVLSIINVFDLIDYLRATNQQEHLSFLQNYQSEYGCKRN